MLPGRGSTHLITAAVPVPVTGLAHPGSSTSSESAERQAPGRSGGHGADETLLSVAFQSLFPHLAESSIKNITSFLMDQGVQNRSQVLDVFRVRAGEALLERASQPSSGLRLIDLAELGKAVTMANRFDATRCGDVSLDASIARSEPAAHGHVATDGMAMSPLGDLAETGSKQVAVKSLMAAFAAGAEVCILWGFGKCRRGNNCAKAHICPVCGLTGQACIVNNHAALFKKHLLSNQALAPTASSHAPVRRDGRGRPRRDSSPRFSEEHEGRRHAASQSGHGRIKKEHRSRSRQRR